MIAGLHVIFDAANEARALELAAMAEAEGAVVVQLRDKHSSDVELIRIGKNVRSILRNAMLIVNDRPDIALAIGADGVHLGQEDMPISEARIMLGSGSIIGISTSSVTEALDAEGAGANYIGFGHMFPTRSKEKASRPRSVEELSAVIAAVSIPVIAIGGITEQNVRDILVPGLGGIAVISAISESPNSRTTIRNFVKLLEEHHATYA